MSHAHLGSPAKRLFERVAAASLVVLLLSCIGLVARPGTAHAGLSLTFPVAVIDASSSLVQINSTVTFSGSRSFGLEFSVVQSWEWDFGDGDQATGSDVQHTFTRAGMHTITLTVTDQFGTSDDATALVFVWDYPKAVLTATSTTGLAPLAAQFDASASTAIPGRTITSYAWDFGDGTAATGPTATHVYSIPGVYLASVTVFDDAGLADTKSQPITVTERLAAPINLKATTPGKHRAVLTWTNRMTALRSMEIQRCTGSSCTRFTTVTFVPSSTSRYLDTGLNSGTTVRYRIKITDLVGAVRYSNITSFTVS